MRTALLLVFLIGSGLMPSPTEAQDAEIETGFTIYPRPLWNSTDGFGVGFGFYLDHLLLPSSRLLLTATPAQHLGLYTASFYTANPYEARTFGVVSGTYEKTGRKWFYGLGPASRRSTKLAIEKETMTAQVRGGLQLWQRRVLIQPSLHLIQHRILDYRDRNDGAFDDLDERSRTSLLFAAGDPASGIPNAENRQTGLAYALTVGLDTRDARQRPRQGVLAQVSARRYDALDDLDLRFDTYRLNLYGFVPLAPGAHVLALRTHAAVTDNRGTTPVPFHMLPSLDSDLEPGFTLDRFHGYDLLLLSAEYRFPVFNVLDLIGLEGLVSIHAASVYDDLFDQFTLDVSFDENLSRELQHYPLRPSLGVGGRLVSLFKDEVYISGMLSLTSEGLGLVIFHFTWDFRGLRTTAR